MSSFESRAALKKKRLAYLAELLPLVDVVAQKAGIVGGKEPLYGWGGRYNFKCGNTVLSLANHKCEERFAYEQRLAQASRGLCPSPAGAGVVEVPSKLNPWLNGTFASHGDSGQYAIGDVMAWQVCEFVQGAPGNIVFADSQDTHLLDRAATALEEFWGIKVAGRGVPIAETAASMPQALWEWEQRLAEQENAGTIKPELAQAAASWGAKHPDVFTPSSPGFAHRDFTATNLIFTRNNVVVVDLERAGDGFVHDELVALVGAGWNANDMFNLRGGWWGRELCERLPQLHFDEQKWRLAALVRFIHLFSVGRFWGEEREAAFLQLAT